jgi:uroporphyrinogen-III synthase
MPGLLTNKILAITRNEHEASEFSQLVSEQGGRAIALPTIEIVPAGSHAVREFIDRLQSKKYNYCAFMSSQAVNALFDMVDKEKVIDSLSSTTIIAVGPKTKQSLEKRGLEVRLMPEKFSSIGLIEMMAKQKPAGKSMIIPRSGSSNEFATKALISIGMQVDEIFLYTVCSSKPSVIWSEFSNLLEQNNINAIIFTSASAVKSFFGIMSKISPADNSIQLDRLTTVISIGPLTSKELEKRKLTYIEAKEHTIKGTLEAFLSIL